MLIWNSSVSPNVACEIFRGVKLSPACKNENILRLPFAFCKSFNETFLLLEFLIFPHVEYTCLRFEKKRIVHNVHMYIMFIWYVHSGIRLNCYLRNGGTVGVKSLWQGAKECLSHVEFEKIFVFWFYSFPVPVMPKTVLQIFGNFDTQNFLWIYIIFLILTKLKNLWKKIINSAAFFIGCAS